MPTDQLARLGRLKSLALRISEAVTSHRLSEAQCLVAEQLALLDEVIAHEAGLPRDKEALRHRIDDLQALAFVRIVLLEDKVARLEAALARAKAAAGGAR